MEMLKPGDPCPLCGEPIKTETHGRRWGWSMDRMTDASWRDLRPRNVCLSVCNTACFGLGPDYLYYGTCTSCLVPKLYARLAAYEDTGLQPEQIDPRFVRPLKAKVRRVKR